MSKETELSLTASQFGKSIMQFKIHNYNFNLNQLVVLSAGGANMATFIKAFL